MIEHEGRFYLYYSAERREGGKRIGVAVAIDRPAPFAILGEPLFDPGFPVIDAHPFIDDDGRAYLFLLRTRSPKAPAATKAAFTASSSGRTLCPSSGNPSC